MDKPLTWRLDREGCLWVEVPGSPGQWLAVDHELVSAALDEMHYEPTPQAEMEERFGADEGDQAQHLATYWVRQHVSLFAVCEPYGALAFQHGFVVGRRLAGTGKALVSIEEPKGGPTVVTLQLDDGRWLDLFPATGTLQVYTSSKRHGFELSLPRWTSEASNQLDRNSVGVWKL